MLHDSIVAKVITLLLRSTILVITIYGNTLPVIQDICCGLEINSPMEFGYINCKIVLHMSLLILLETLPRHYYDSKEEQKENFACCPFDCKRSARCTGRTINH